MVRRVFSPIIRAVSRECGSGSFGGGFGFSSKYDHVASTHILVLLHRSGRLGA